MHRNKSNSFIKSGIILKFMMVFCCCTATLAKTKKKKKKGFALVFCLILEMFSTSVLL